MNIITLLWPAALTALIATSGSAEIARDQDPVEALHPPEQDCTMSSARSRALRLAPMLQKGFGVQYWGSTYDAETLSRQPHGLLIIEVTKVGAPYSDTGHEVFFTPEEIARINRDGTRPALGYLNVSEIEDYRDYWIDHIAGVGDAASAELPEWYGPSAGHGGHLAAYWTRGWHDIILTRVDRLMQTGIDGLFLDDVLHYYSLALDETLRWPGDTQPKGPKDAPAHAREMMHLVGLIAERAREWKCDAFIVVNNGVFIGRDAAGTAPELGDQAPFARYLDAVDAVMVENLSAPSTHAHTIEALQEDFRGHGVAVLALDIATQFPDKKPDELRQLVARSAAQSGFYPYVAIDAAFNQVAPAMPLPAR